MTNPTRPGKKRRAMWWLILIVLVAGLLWFTWFRWSVSRRLAAQIASLESQGYPVTLDQLDAWYQLPDGANNGADDYTEAFVWRVAWNNDVRSSLPIVGSASLPEPNMPLDPNMLALMQDYLADNAKAMAWLDQGAQCEHVRWPGDYRDGIMLQMPWLSDIRECGRLYAIKMLIAIEQGDSVAVVRSWSSGMALAGSLEQIPSLIGQLVRLSCMGTLRGTLERGLARLEFTDEQLVQLSDRLASAMEVDSLIRATAGEVCFMLDGLQNTTPEFGDEMGFTRFMLVPYRLAGLMHRDLCEYLALNEIMLNPRPTSMQEFLTAGKLAQKKAQAVPKSHLMLRMVLPALGSITRVYSRHYAGQISTQTALAALRYDLKYQHLPEKIDGLIPEFMDTMPVDPFDGESVRYVKRYKGFIVYSVGEDGQDNGGRIKDPNDRDRPHDLVFSVQKMP